jgi:hypothetical protein
LHLLVRNRAAPQINGIHVFRSLCGRVVNDLVRKKHVDDIGVAAAVLGCVPEPGTTVTDVFDYFIEFVSRLGPILSNLLLNAS